MSLHPKLKTSTTKFWPHLSTTVGDVGVEIELEGDHLPKLVPGWDAKRDNSLRGADGRQVPETDETSPDIPREYVTKGAVKLTALPELLSALAAQMQGQTVVRKGQRTSTHIHVNMQDATVKDIIGYIVTWAIIEPLLLRNCGPDRNGNLFCLPFSETYDFSTGVIPQWVEATQQQSGGRYWIKRGKYACLNTDPLHVFGTLEARCFPASIDPEQVMTWAKWVTNVKTVSTSWRDDSFGTLIDLAYKSPMDIVSMVFENYNVYGNTAPQTAPGLIREGVETAYEIWRAFRPLFDYSRKKLVKGGPPVMSADDGDLINDLNVGSIPYPHEFQPFQAPPPEFYDGDDE